MNKYTKKLRSPRFCRPLLSFFSTASNFNFRLIWGNSYSGILISQGLSQTSQHDPVGRMMLTAENGGMMNRAAWITGQPGVRAFVRQTAAYSPDITGAFLSISTESCLPSLSAERPSAALRPRIASASCSLSPARCSRTNPLPISSQQRSAFGCAFSAISRFKYASIPDGSSNQMLAAEFVLINQLHRVLRLHRRILSGMPKQNLVQLTHASFAFCSA